MAGFNWKSIVGTVAPTIASALGGPLAGMAVSAISNVLLGNPDGKESDIAQAIAKDPDVLFKLKQAEQAFAQKMKELDIDIIKLEVEDRASARAREIALKDWMPKVLALVYTVGYFAILMLVWMYGFKAENNREVLTTLFGIISAAQMAIITYYFGSSSGSARKSETIEQVLRR